MVLGVVIIPVKKDGQIRRFPRQSPLAVMCIDYHPNAHPGLIVTCLVVASVLQLLCLAIVYICVSVTLA